MSSNASKRQPRPKRASSLGSPLATILIICSIYALLGTLTLRRYWALPTPVLSPTSPDGRAQLSEAVILGHAKYLTEDIGYRIVGTVENAKGDEWMLAKAEELKSECERVVGQNSGRKLQCEVFHQRGNGSFNHDMMSKRLYKMYIDITNVIVRVSDGTDQGKEHALLVNAHHDSQLTSPGAADDALAVGVMLDCMRVLVDDETWSPTNAVIFLFNNAEESLCDASHLFATQHPLAQTVRAVVNLEAMGTTKPPMLFQATSEEMIQAYSKVPHPFGTIIAADVFGSGVMLSDTDFRSFVDYLDVSGLDFAVIGNSYLYHMRKDLVENIGPGVAQQMAENTLSLIRTLTNTSTASNSKVSVSLSDMANGYTKPRSVYFSYLGYFVVYPKEVGTAICAALTATALLAATLIPVSAPAFTTKNAGSRPSRLGELVKAILLSIGTLVGAIIGSNALAAIMNALGRSHSWFSQPWMPLPLYAPPALVGCLLARIILPDTSEHAVLAGTSFLLVGLGTAMHAAGIGSGLVLILSGAPLFLPLFLSSNSSSSANVIKPISVWTYTFVGLSALVTGTQLVFSALEVFVPLTGRMGAEAPAEHIVASLVALLSAYALPILPALSVRWPKTEARKGVMVFTAIVIVVAGVYALLVNPFDDMHQRRLYIVHMQNTTSGLEHINIAASDGAPGFVGIVEALGQEFGMTGSEPATKELAKPKKVAMNDWNADWDVAYPFSQFMMPWKFELAPSQIKVDADAENRQETIEVRAVENYVNLKDNTRELTLKVTAYGVIWPVIAFDAHVISWTLSDPPERGRARYHIKTTAFLGSDTSTLGLVINTTVTPGMLAVSHSGIRRQTMWPARKNDEPRDPATRLFERVDGWLEEKYGGSIDAALMGAVGGVTDV